MENFDEYIRQGEPNKAEKAKVWKTAIGLQQVDGLTPSDYLIATAKQNIEGDITIEEVKQRIDPCFWRRQHPYNCNFFNKIPAKIGLYQSKQRLVC